MAGWDASNVSSVPLDLNVNAVDGGGVGGDEKKLDALATFKLFLMSHRGAAGSSETYPYRSQLKANYTQGEYHFTLNLSDLQAFNRPLCDAFKNRPAEYLPLLEDAAKDVIAANTIPKPNVAEMPPMQCIVTNFPAQTPIRFLASGDVEKLVTVNGIVINASKPRIKATRLAIVCRNCKSVRYITPGPGFGTARLPRICEGVGGNNASAAAGAAPVKCPLDPFVVLPDSTKYTDQQRLKLQESPEAVPTGEMPRSLSLSAERYLVGRCKPGQRVSIIGVYTTFNAKSGGGGGAGGSGASSSGKAANIAGNTSREVGIRLPYLRVLGLEIDSADERGLDTFTAAEEEHIQKIARSGNLYDRIARSIGPAIYGSEEIKRALACQLFGGSRKLLPDGMRLRGDINVLLLGDPSVAKSQFLKFVYQVAPIGVYTSGKGSSAAGLTASVLRDPSSGEFHLEGGALVLADGGLVCIDEFDKMREQDRVAIHEAMEQQTISIAKAGITTILNSRTSVLAAANPVFGRYDDMKSPTENIDFQTTILSRFDIIFVIKDVHDPTRDKALVEYMVNLHRQRAQLIADQPDIIEVAALKKYIQYARQRCAPRLSEDAAKVLQSHYVTIRAEHAKQKEESAHGRLKKGTGSAIPITVRQLEAIVRVSEALARLELKDEATSDHVNEAIRLFKVSTLQAALSQYGDGAVVGTAAFLEQVQSFERTIRRRIPIGSRPYRSKLVDDLTQGEKRFEAAANKAIDVMVQRQDFKTHAMGKLLERLR